MNYKEKIKEKSIHSLNKQLEYSKKNRVSEKAINFIDKIAENQKTYIDQNHQIIYNDLKDHLTAGNKTKQKIEEKYKLSSTKNEDIKKLFKLLDNHRGFSIDKFLQVGGIIFFVLLLLLFAFKAIKPPFILIGFCLSAYFSSLINKGKPFEIVFKKKDDYSDPISKLLINQYNDSPLSLSEIEELKDFLTVEEFISAFGDDVNQLSLKYGDNSLRTILNNVRYNYMKENKENRLKTIYYNKKS